MHWLQRQIHYVHCKEVTDTRSGHLRGYDTFSFFSVYFWLWILLCCCLLRTLGLWVLLSLSEIAHGFSQLHGLKKWEATLLPATFLLSYHCVAGVLRSDYTVWVVSDRLYTFSRLNSISHVSIQRNRFNAPSLAKYEDRVDSSSICCAERGTEPLLRARRAGFPTVAIFHHVRPISRTSGLCIGYAFSLSIHCDGGS